MGRFRSKRFSYFTGLGAVVLLLPALAYAYMYNADMFSDDRCLNLAMIDPNREYWPYPLPFERKYATYIIDADKERNKDKFKEARELIHTLANTSDTINGVRFDFAKGSKYSNLIKMITICHEEDIDFFMLLDNSFYVISELSSSEIKKEKDWFKERYSGYTMSSE
ncbi:hypothetical protein FUA48_01335 [Flavobacterium alkalisoli]|uniref:Uncharacterized protein n=1 Tax=Flavobacterium alkalisoli TaxID=2602769 RepID=A0A5B9FNC0_9FLAO|nr:hypothetical protein [Flavobacterium alkalisoli]QEE48265.1 hypothetical protein FUA48_01335 [Flavobacterium alkalisoli]